MMYLPVEGFRQFAEFWQTMGSDRPWKPAVHAVITLPVPQPTFVMGGIVTTWLAKVALENGSGAPDLLVGIGGVVQDHTGAPVSGAWVRLEDAAGRPRRHRRAAPDRHRPTRSAGSRSTGWARPTT